MLLVPGALSGCGEKDQTESKSAAAFREDVKREARKDYDTTRAYTQEQMRAFREQTEPALSKAQSRKYCRKPIDRSSGICCLCRVFPKVTLNILRFHQILRPNESFPPSHAFPPFI